MGSPAKRKSGKPKQSELADRHELYEQAVQDVETEVDLVQREFRRIRGREPVGFREDFCGTASAACQWVRSGEARFAIGVDLEPEVLQWGREHRLSRLSPVQRQRVKLLNEDVLTVRTDPVDVIGAFNFSYWTFRTRDGLRAYLSNARAGLVGDGLLFLDIYGGSEAYRECREKTRHDGFTYVWEQERFDPATADYHCHIHFRFPDGSKLKRAYSYHWRLWTLPELRELLQEAGFSRVRLLAELEDEEGEGSGEYAEVAAPPNDPAWIAYVVAER